MLLLIFYINFFITIIMSGIVDYNTFIFYINRKMDHNSYCYNSQYINKTNIYEIENQNYYDSLTEDGNGNLELKNQSEVDGDTLLISLVRNHPYLYNKELTDFKDTMKKQNAWREIGNILNMTGN